MVDEDAAKMLSSLSDAECRQLIEMILSAKWPAVYTDISDQELASRAQILVYDQMIASFG